MKLEITKERVLEAASKCSTAKEILTTLFPEVFDDEERIVASLGDKFVISGEQYLLGLVDSSIVGLICIRDGNRWSHPVKVDSVRELTCNEFRKLISDNTMNIDEILCTKYK